MRPRHALTLIALLSLAMTGLAAAHDGDHGEDTSDQAGPGSGDTPETNDTAAHDQPVTEPGAGEADQPETPDANASEAPPMNETDAPEQSNDTQPTTDVNDTNVTTPAGLANALAMIEERRASLEAELQLELALEKRLEQLEKRVERLEVRHEEQDG